MISKLPSHICPVNILRTYIDMAGLSSDDSFIFRRLARSKGPVSYKVTKINKPLSYTTCRLDLISVITKIGLNPKDYGLHSARSGGATWAANAGVPDRLFKRHGRWVSERAKDGYVKDNLDSLICVTQNLGL